MSGERRILVWFLNRTTKLRFRLSGNFDGYLYVMNLNTSGQYVLLFPREDTGQANKIQAGQGISCAPRQKAGFGSRGPAGYEIVYWLVSPVDLQNEPIDSKPSLPPAPSSTIGQAPGHSLASMRRFNLQGPRRLYRYFCRAQRHWRCGEFAGESEPVLRARRSRDLVVQPDRELDRDFISHLVERPRDFRVSSRS